MAVSKPGAAAGVLFFTGAAAGLADETAPNPPDGAAEAPCTGAAAIPGAPNPAGEVILEEEG